MKRKQYTVVALCKCGCREINLFYHLAKNSTAAKVANLRQQDPEWPLEILAVVDGRLKFNPDLRGRR